MFASPFRRFFPPRLFRVLPAYPFGVSSSFQQIMAHLIVGILSKDARDIFVMVHASHRIVPPVGEHEIYCRDSTHRIAGKRNIAARSGAHCLPSIVTKVNIEVVCCRNFSGSRGLTTDVRWWAEPFTPVMVHRIQTAEPNARDYCFYYLQLQSNRQLHMQLSARV